MVVAASAWPPAAPGVLTERAARTCRRHTPTSRSESLSESVCTAMHGRWRVRSSTALCGRRSKQSLHRRTGQDWCVLHGRGLARSRRRLRALKARRAARAAPEAPGRAGRARPSRTRRRQTARCGPAVLRPAAPGLGHARCRRPHDGLRTRAGGAAGSGGGGRARRAARAAAGGRPGPHRLCAGAPPRLARCPAAGRSALRCSGACSQRAQPGAAAL